MKKWNNQISKIYSLFFFFLYIEKFNERKIEYRGIVKKIKINNFGNCSVVFIKHNKAIKKKELVKNSILRKNAIIRLKLIHCIPMNGNWLDWKHLFKFRPQEISTYYSFNKKANKSDRTS